jgi:hypothetical protein
MPLSPSKMCIKLNGWIIWYLVPVIQFKKNPAIDGMNQLEYIVGNLN